MSDGTRDIHALVKLATEARQMAEAATQTPPGHPLLGEYVSWICDERSEHVEGGRYVATGTVHDAIFLAYARANVPALAKGVLDLAADNQAIASELSNVHDRLMRKAQPIFGAFGEADGAVTMTASDRAGVTEFLYSTLAGMLEGVSGGLVARNYIEMYGTSKAIGPITVRIERVGRVTPHQARQDAEAALARAVALLRANGLPWEEPTTFAPDDPEPMPAQVDPLPWIRLDVRARPNALVCERCGARQEMPHEGTADVFDAIVQTFQAAHSECEMGDDYHTMRAE